MNWYFLLKKWHSHFFNEKYWRISDINIWNFNEMLTNNVVSFEQPGPDKDICNSNLYWQFLSNPCCLT